MKFLENFLIGQMIKSKKFWYAISSVVVPAIVTYLGVDETTASNLYYALLALVLGQGTQQDIVYNSTLAMDLLIKEIINLGGKNINLIIKNK